MRFVDIRMIQGKGLLNLERNMCRWPIGDAQGRAQRFCAEPIKIGSYCVIHHARSRAKPCVTQDGSETPLGDGSPITAQLQI
jgi:hypothetical protein